MALKYVQALTLAVPEAAVEEVLALLPEGALAESAFHAPQGWVVQALYPTRPATGELSAALAVLAASRGEADYGLKLEELPTQGWLAANQDSFAPIHAGRIVIHSARDKAAARAPLRGIELESSAAFGTGEHPTTRGCLLALQEVRNLKRNSRVFDLGTGTAVLAMGVARLAPIQVVAVDNEAESVGIARANLRRNGLAARIKAFTAQGFTHARVRRGAPYALIISNIFARPLARLAPAMRAHLAGGGQVILAGFLHKDANRVLSAYRAQGLFLRHHRRLLGWSILTLHKPSRR